MPQRDGSDVVVVNETGNGVFHRCDGSRSCETIAAEVATESGADEDTVLRDVVAFVARLHDAGLLEVGHPATSPNGNL